MSTAMRVAPAAAAARPSRAAVGRSLARGEAQIWFASLDEPFTRMGAERVLSDDERARAARFHFARDRDRFVARRIILRKLLAQYVRRAPEDIRLAYGPRGKPALGGPDDGSRIRFNASHSHGTGVFVVTADREVGVDIERFPAPDDGDDVARHFFAPAEVAALQPLPAAERSAAFLRCWTRKEAYIKSRGDGLSLPLDSFEVSLTRDDPPALLATHHDPADAGRWSLFDLSNHCPGHVAALAIAGDDVALRIDWI